MRDDSAAAFTLDGAPVLGRVARLAVGSIDPILRRHDYPRPVALLLGEALTLAALIGALFKVPGRFVLQAQGQGLVPLLVAERRDDGALRGYARLAEGAAERLVGGDALSPRALLGEGALLMSLDLGPDMDPVQGVVALDGPTLSACAEAYFTQSQQVPTRIRTAVAEYYAPGELPFWRAQGLLIQRVASDDARGSTDEDWARAEILLATVRDEELADPKLPTETLLYQLFHEDGVRLSPEEDIGDRCTCDAGRLGAVLSRFTAEEVAELTEPDGLLHARCQFCARSYQFDPGSLAGVG